jgi:NTE family protein
MDTCGIVIAGGGARGAYEAGALSVLLPALEAEHVAPTIFVGTSAGSINATAFAALINYGATEASRRVLEVWRSVRPRSVYEPVPWGLARGAASTGWDLLAGAPRPSIGLLDPGPLRRTLDAQVPWGQIRQNLRHPEMLEAVAIAATDERDYRTRVFVAQDPARALPPPDEVRNIDYRLTELSSAHVLASSALPVVFPAVSIHDPDGGARWYADGGVRLNTPLLPALALGARRLVVVATAPMKPSPAPRAAAPGLPAGLGQILHAILVDRMVEDLRRLQERNRPGSSGAKSFGQIPFLFAGPETTDAMADLVAQALRRPRLAGGCARGVLARLRHLSGSLAARDAALCEAMSYLFFDPDFIEAAIEAGQRDARGCLCKGKLAWIVGP